MPRSAPSLFVALLAGGRGTRFWPLSRAAKPKQLLDVTGEGPLLRRTLERVEGLVPRSNVVVVTSRDVAPEARRLLRLPASQVLAEPVGRNTAPAVALAVAWASRRDPEAVVLCLPADHHVGNPRRLRTLLTTAAREARRLEAPVLLGIEPDGPSSDYGYIVPAKDAARSGLRAVARFAEKPATAAAKRLLARGALWNSGMFVLPARATLEALGRHLPGVRAAVASLPFHRPGRALDEALARAWPKLPAASFDASVLERWRGVHVLPAGDLGWSDVGSWDALAALVPPDARGNRARGPVVFHASDGCFAFQHDSSRTLVLLGARDLVLVDAGDVVLAAPRSALPRLRDLVARLDRERPELT